MTAKKYLQQLKDIDCLINTMSDEILELEYAGMKITPIIKDVPVQSSDQHNKIENAAVNVVDLEMEMAKQITKLIVIKKRAVSIIEQLDKLQYRTVLMKYYVQNKTYEQTAEEMGMSFRWIYDLCTKALYEFQKYMPEDLLHK